MRRFVNDAVREPNWFTTRSKSLERRSRTCAAERPARFRIAVRLSLRCSSKMRERISCSKSRNLIGMLFRLLSFVSRAWGDSRHSCIFIRDSQSGPRPAAPDWPVKPNQNAPQHARQVLASLGITPEPEHMVGGAAGRSLTSPRFNSTGKSRGRCKLNVSTGPSERTQVSLLPPPRCMETTGVSIDGETRASPPGITTQESPSAAR